MVNPVPDQSPLKMVLMKYQLHPCRWLTTAINVVTFKRGPYARRFGRAKMMENKTQTLTPLYTPNPELYEVACLPQGLEQSHLSH
jgi:hypothetical protein